MIEATQHATLIPGSSSNHGTPVLRYSPQVSHRDSQTIPLSWIINASARGVRLKDKMHHGPALIRSIKSLLGSLRVKSKALALPMRPIFYQSSLPALLLHSLQSFHQADLSGVSSSSHLVTLRCVVDFEMLFFKYVHSYLHISLKFLQMLFYWYDVLLNVFFSISRYNFPFGLQHRNFLLHTSQLIFSITFLSIYKLIKTDDQSSVLNVTYTLYNLFPCTLFTKM